MICYFMKYDAVRWVITQRQVSFTLPSNLSINSTILKISSCVCSKQTLTYRMWRNVRTCSLHFFRRPLTASARLIVWTSPQLCWTTERERYWNSDCEWVSVWESELVWLSVWYLDWRTMWVTTLRVVVTTLHCIPRILQIYWHHSQIDRCISN